MTFRPIYTVLLLMPLLQSWRWARLWVSWKPGCRLTAWSSTLQNPIYLVWYTALTAAACEARPSPLPSLLTSLILSFPLLFVTLELHWIKSSPSLHIFTASVVIHTTSYASSALCSFAHFRCHRYTYPCLYYSPTRLLKLTLCWAPSCAATVPRPDPAFGCTPLWAHP